MIERNHSLVSLKKVSSGENENPMTSPEAPREDVAFQQAENSLRPKTLSEYIGQEKVKLNLQVFLDAAKKRSESLEHVLLHGPPGLGKTTLAGILAHEMQAGLRMSSGPALEKQGDIASLLTNLQEGDILFIDEIHRLRPAVEEVLYTAMEDFALDLIIGKGPSARSMRLSLPRFTLVGATMKVSLLSSPLRDRFGHTFKLEFYTHEEIRQILVRSAGILGCNLELGAARLLSECSRSTPRVANRLLRRVRDFSDVRDLTSLSESLTAEVLERLGVDSLGLDKSDRSLLHAIITRFKGGPVGLNTLSASLCEEEETIEDIYEPYLLQLGLLERTSRGRVATHRAYRHLEISY